MPERMSAEGLATLATPTTTRIAQAGIARLPKNLSTRVQGRVALQLLHSYTEARGTVLALYRSMSADWMFQVLSMTPSRTRTVFEIRLRAPFDLSDYLRLQPGVRWVRQQIVSKPSGKTTLQVGLDEGSLPPDEGPMEAEDHAATWGLSSNPADGAGASLHTRRDYVTLHVRETPTSPGATQLIRELRLHPKLRLLSVASRKGRTTISLSVTGPVRLADLLSTMEGVQEVHADHKRRHVSSTSEFDVVFG